jgi:hypothetical protein
MSREPDNLNPYRTSPQAAPEAATHSTAARIALPLFMLFGGLYFVQGLVEPTAGLLAQPYQSQLEDWGQTPTAVGSILGFIGIPWSLKPLFGPVSDFLPFGGRRRQPYLVLSTAAAAIAFFAVAWLWTGPERLNLTSWLLLLACGAVAMTDVVIDALAVETGQPLGLTGQMQSVQWGAMSLATTCWWRLAPRSPVPAGWSCRCCRPVATLIKLIRGRRGVPIVRRLDDSTLIRPGQERLDFVGRERPFFGCGWPRIASQANQIAQQRFDDLLLFFVHQPPHRSPFQWASKPTMRGDVGGPASCHPPHF